MALTRSAGGALARPTYLLLALHDSPNKVVYIITILPLAPSIYPFFQQFTLFNFIQSHLVYALFILKTYKTLTQV